MKQTVYIFRCENSVVQIKGKVNSVTIDGCKKTSVVFDNMLSQVEVINSQSIEIQSLGTLPTVSIQKTDGCQVYLSKESINAEIVTSKSSEMNILVPNGDEFVRHFKKGICNFFRFRSNVQFQNNSRLLSIKPLRSWKLQSRTLFNAYLILFNELFLYYYNTTSALQFKLVNFFEY